MEYCVQVTTISSFCKTVSAELGIDLQNIQLGNYKLQFPICIITGGYKYHGNLDIQHFVNNKSLQVAIENASVVEAEVSLTISQNSNQYKVEKCVILEHHLGDFLLTQLWTTPSSGSPCPVNFGSPFSIKVRIKIVFKPTIQSQSDMGVIQNLQKSFTSSKMKSLEEAQDSPIFTLKVENETFDFNKNSLLAVSSVFADMFAACTEGNFLTIEDGTSIQTMNTFMKLMQNQEIKKDELTADLYLFGDKYNIQTLAINRENIIEVAHSAYKVKNDALLELSTKFLKNNETILKTDEKMKHLYEYDKEFCAKLLWLIHMN